MNFNRLPTSAISGVALSGVLLTGCSQNPDLIFSPDRVTPAVANGFIYDDVNVRKSPQRIEDQAADNSCDKRTDSAIILEAVTVAVSEGIGNDSNGDWIGFKPESLPADIAEDCRSDYGGMLWIAKSYVEASISEAAQPFNIAN